MTFEKITMAGQNGKIHIWNIITIPNATTSTARKWCHIRSSSDGSDSSDIRYMVFAPGRHIVLDGKAGRSQQGLPKSENVLVYLRIATGTDMMLCEFLIRSCLEIIPFQAGLGLG